MQPRSPWPLGCGQCMVCSPTEHLPLSRPAGCVPPGSTWVTGCPETSAASEARKYLSAGSPGRILRYPASTLCAEHSPCGVHSPGCGGTRPHRVTRVSLPSAEPAAEGSCAFEVQEKEKLLLQGLLSYDPTTRASTVATSFLNF